MQALIIVTIIVAGLAWIATLAVVMVSEEAAERHGAFSVLVALTLALVTLSLALGIGV